MKILVIDDDIQCNEMLCMILKFSGHHALAAFDGDEGIKLFVREHPDLVITDLYMPEKEGIETIIEIRKLDQKVKILAISGGSPRLDVTEMFPAATLLGADAVLAKPFDSTTLTKIINELMAAQI
ncbi:MAG: response regulator [Geobacteraceae bacterium]|nr:response regulator [Geobacteraceae bacterium]